MNKNKIFFFIDNVNGSFPGYSILVDNLLKYIPNSGVIDNIDNIDHNSIVIPIGITASDLLIKAGVNFKISFLTDSPTLTFKSLIRFYLKQRIFSKTLFGTFLRLIKYSFLERKVVRYSEKIIVVSDYDKVYLENKYNCNHVISIPNGVNLPKLIMPKLSPFNPTIGFLYYWGVQNSIDDIDWFIRGYLPIIKKEFPDLEVIAAGKGANVDAIKYFNTHKINYIGEVDDLNDFFSKIDVFITTVRKKCGILNKVLDAVAHKKIVMAFEDNMLAFKGLKNGFYSYKTVSDLIDNLNKIKSNSSEVEIFIQNSHNYINKHHNWNTNYNKFYSLIKRTYNIN